MSSILSILKLTVAICLICGTFAYAAERKHDKDLIIGHISLLPQIASSEEKVAEAAEKLAQEDSNFVKLAVVGVNEKEFGIYFYYKKNGKVKTNDDFVKLLKPNGFAAWSFAGSPVVIK